MTALSNDRLFRSRSLGRNFAAKVAANAIPYQGGLVSVNATGFAKASSTTAGERVIGWSTGKIDNTGGADGAAFVNVQTGVIKLNNDGTNPVGQADVGRMCFVKDDNTVQTASGGCAVIAGRVEQIDSDGGIWVLVEQELGVVDGRNVDVSVDATSTVALTNAPAAVPAQDVFYAWNIADAASANYPITVKEKIEVLDVTVIKIGAGAGNTVQITNGVSNISDAIAAAVDKTVTRAGSIDATTPTNVIAAGGTLQANVTRAAGSGAMKVIVWARRVP